MSAGRLMPPGGASPPLDGKTPVFEEMGSDPRLGSGADRPQGSIARWNTLYLWKIGTAATAWRIFPLGIVEGYGVSSIGNTLGTTGTVQSTVVLAGVSGVTLSQSTNSNGATISIIASAETGIGLAAGTQTAQTGVVVFSNSNNVSFGLSNSSVVTASFGGPQPALAAGTQTATSGTVVLSNSNGVSFGMSNSSVITASVTREPSIQAGTQTATSGTVVFSNSNNVSFGLSNSSVVTASFGGPQAAIAAGTQTATSGTVVFSNSNGVTFGLSGSSRVTASYDGIRSVVLATGGASTTVVPSAGSVFFSGGGGISLDSLGAGPNGVLIANAGVVTAGVFGSAGATDIPVQGSLRFSSSGGIEFGISTAAGGGTVTARPNPVSYQVNNGVGRGVFIGDVSNGTIHCAPWHIYNPINATRADLLFAVSNSSSAAATITMRLGLYTMSGSTASQVSSTSRTWAYNSTLAQGSYTQVSGTRFRSMGLGTWAVTPGMYMLAQQYSVGTALTSGTHQPLGGRDISINADEYPLSLGARAGYWGGGFHSVASAGLPASMHLTDIVVSGSNDILFVPYVTFAGTF